MRTLSRQDLEDILLGCTYLGCGGGGDYHEGLKLIHADLEQGRRFRLLRAEEMGEEDFAASLYYLGSTAPASPEAQHRYGQLPRLEQAPTVAVFRLLERMLGKKFMAVLPGEIGPGNTAAALSAAARLNLPALDADTIGRSAPEVNQNSLLVAGLPVVPAAAVTSLGDELFLPQAAAPSRAEEIWRALAAPGLELGVADSVVSGRDARRPNALVTGSVSQALQLGRASRQARAAGREAIEAVLEAGGGCRLFTGRIAEFHWKDEGGFLLGEVTLAGSGRDNGAHYRIWFKNEHLMAWRDDQVEVMPPDLIVLVDTESGQGLPNPQFTRGQQVAALGFPAPALWRTPRGLAAFGPQAFGFQDRYRPLEERPRQG